jgi:hypothetical protein
MNMLAEIGAIVLLSRVVRCGRVRRRRERHELIGAVGTPR